MSKSNIKRLICSLLTLAVVCCTTTLTALAEENTVRDVNITLYSTSEAVLYASPDLNSQVILSKEDFEDDLPINVTGITDNGFFRVDVGAIYYIPAIGLTELSSTQNKEKQVYDTMISLKPMYPEGMHWTNDNYYGWHGGVYSGGYGCAGFAFLLSDVAFGEKKAIVHSDYNNIRVGDILRVYHDTHSVIVLEVKPDSVIVAEGNYNSSIHWGREMPKMEIQDEYSYIMTRY